MALTKAVPLLITLIMLSIAIQSVPDSPALQSSEKLRKGPYLIYPGNDTSMTILWQTYDTALDSAIEWGGTKDYSDGKAIVSENNGYQDGHQFSYTITNLTPESKIYYKVIVDGMSYDGTFMTSPDSSSKSLSFYAYGDTRTNPGIHEGVISQLMADIRKKPEDRQTFLLHGGDFVTNGDQETSWDDEYFNRSNPNTTALLSMIPVMGGMGNHEETGRLFRKYWPYSYEDENHGYYSFDYGPVHVAVLDQYSADFGKGSAQYSWLEQDLNSTTKTWKVVMIHQPGWTAKSYDEAKQPVIYAVRHDLHDLFKEKDVDAVVQGHMHYYARSLVDGIQYLTLAAGGAPQNRDPNYQEPYLVAADKVYHFARFDISGEKMNVSVISDKGRIVESFSIENR